MASIRIAAVLRDGKFSPNHIGNDAAILYDTVTELRRKGFEINIYSENRFEEVNIDEDIVLAMCRGRESVKKLQQLEDLGKVCVNSGYGIENCIRMFMLKRLTDAGVATPEYLVVDTDVDMRTMLAEAGFESAWVKIADDHLHHLEDICRCRHVDEVQEILHEFFYRKIKKAAVSKNVEGDMVRFYGIASLGWFDCFMPYGKRAVESPRDNEILTESARRICMRAAEALNVDIFGGDLAITQSGEFLIVNFDDWPSFGPIRKEAAKAIAKSVLQRARKMRPKR